MKKVAKIVLISVLVVAFLVSYRGLVIYHTASELEKLAKSIVLGTAEEVANRRESLSDYMRTRTLGMPKLFFDKVSRERITAYLVEADVFVTQDQLDEAEADLAAGDIGMVEKRLVFVDQILAPYLVGGYRMIPGSLLYRVAVIKARLNRAKKVRTLVTDDGVYWKE